VQRKLLCCIAQKKLYIVLRAFVATMEMLMAMTDPKPSRAAKAVGETAEKKTVEATEKVAQTAKDVAEAAFAYPKFEMPEAFRSFAEQGLTQSREAYARAKAAAEEATDMLEESFETTRESVRDVQLKALDVARANADATFDLARQLLTVTSVADAVQIQSTFARERFEALVDYSKDVQAAFSKVGAEATKPAKAMFGKAFNYTKAA
jgi:phasin